MTAETNLDMSGWMHEQLEQASPDLLRSMVQLFERAGYTQIGQDDQGFMLFSKLATAADRA